MEQYLPRDTVLCRLRVNFVRLNKHELVQALLDMAALIEKTPLESGELIPDKSLEYRLDTIESRSIPEDQMHLEVLP